MPRSLAVLTLAVFVPLAGFAAEPVGNTPEMFAVFEKSEATKHARLVGASGTRVD